MSAIALIDLYAVGAAALALWLLIRFPGFGPHSLRPATVLTVAAVMLVPPLEILLGFVRHSEGRAAALLLVALPMLTGIFWASGCFVRAAAGAIRR